MNEVTAEGKWDFEPTNDFVLNLDKIDQVYNGTALYLSFWLSLCDKLGECSHNHTGLLFP